MPKKNMTPAERKAWGEKMKAAKAAKAQEKTLASENIQNPYPPQPVEVSQSAPEQLNSETELDQLRRHVQELEQLIRGGQLGQAVPAQPQAQVTPQGGIVGTVTKFSVKLSDYPDPRDRLFDEQKLKLKGFNRNWWDLDWTVTPVKYDTRDGIHVIEPKFQLRLIRILEDEETGEPSAKRYTLWKGTFFEDPEAAMQVAFDAGIDVPANMEKAFLDEMRYLRMRDWLLEAFYPPKPSQSKTNKVEAVIGNRLVEVYEINSTNSETIPFKNLRSKI